jgi:predicted membrane-bound spermidine synthase
LAVFLCGALVMIYEITGSRIVSPFIGTSTYVWTSLIGTILGALSLGYWIGGRMADKRPNIKILAGAVFLAGGAVSLTILLKEVLLSAIGSAPLGIGLKAVLASLFLFAPASVLLGFVTPYAAKLRISSLDVSGRTVGRLYALSTVGSIVGTFAAGFVLIPFVGSVRTLYLIAVLLFAVSISLAAFSLTRSNVAVIILFILAISLNEMSSYYLLKTAGLHDIDTEYSRVQVFRTTDPRSGRPIQAMAIDPYFTQSAVFLDSDELVFDYNKYYDLSEHFKPGKRSSLMIGGAGYSYPKHYLETFVNSTMDVVEIDPKMTGIAGEFFRLKDDPRLKSIHEDGRVFLNSAPSRKYDAVLMDAFGSLFTVPYQLTTIEAVREIDRVLVDDGVVIFNVGSALTGKGSRFFQAEFKTYQAVFPRVYVFKVHQEHGDERLQNLMIVACKSGNKIGLENSDPAFADLLSHAVNYSNDVEFPILTDDLAPVEYYNSIAQDIYLRD